MSRTILIVGGGLAGTIVANGLCRQLGAELRSGALDVVMLGASPTHMYQPGLLYVPFGRMREAELFRDQRKVLDRRVNFFVDPARRIDVDKCQVTTEAGRAFRYDYLVLATGSRIVPESVPGMAEGAHWFYDLEGARRLRDALDAFQGGRVVINVNVPHKCPVTPLEVAFMLHDHLKARKLWDRTELTYTYPIGRVHALEPVARWAGPEFERLGIRTATFFNTEEVDPANRVIRSMEGDELPYDLLITIPPHRGAPVIEESGLGRGGWVPTHPRTLRREGSGNVFVVGDTTTIPISKAGSTAHYQAEVAVANLVSLCQENRMAREYDGKVFCFVETGLGAGTHVWFDYDTPPRLAPPGQMIHWFKLAYNRLYWLSARGLL